MAGVVAGAAAGAVLPFAITAWYGAGRDSDAYFLVYGVAIFLGGSAAATAEATVLPFLAEARIVGRRAVRSLLHQTALRAAVLQAALVALVLCGVVVRGRFSTGPDDQGVVGLAIVIAALPILMTVSGVLSAGHYTFGRFGTPSYLLIWRSGVALLAAATWHGTGDLRPIAAGLVLGEVGRAVTLRLQLRRALDSLPDGPPVTPRHRSMLSVAGPHASSQYLLAASPLVDRMFAATVGIGAVTVVELAEKAYYAPALLLNSVVANVATAQWSDFAAAADFEGLRRSFRRIVTAGVATAVVVALAGAAVLWLARLPLAELLGFDDPRVLPGTVSIYLVGLPFALVHALAMRLLVVVKSTAILFKVTLPMVVINVLGDLVLAPRFGVYGIAATTTAVAAVSAATYLWHIRRTLFR